MSLTLAGSPTDFIISDVILHGNFYHRPLHSPLGNFEYVTKVCVIGYMLYKEPKRLKVDNLLTYWIFSGYDVRVLTIIDENKADIF